MTEIELSIMDYGPESIAILGQHLAEFEAQTHIRVRLNVMVWEQAWADSEV